MEPQLDSGSSLEREAAASFYVPPGLEWLGLLEKSSDKGGDFARLVGELVVNMHPDATPYLAMGVNDGSIDICSPSEGIFWECKYIAIHAKDSAKSATASWGKVSAKLSRNLIRTADKPDVGKFAPWYDQRSELKKYVFCTSARFGSDSDRRKLEERIRSDFQKFSSRNGLAHLAKATVEVWGAERITGMLADNDKVRIRRFGFPLPLGVRSFRDWRTAKIGDEKDPARRNFHAYLFEPALSYQYLADASLHPSRILESLMRSAARGLVIYGDGGAGKTRLALETAAAAERGGWPVFVLEVEQVTRDTIVDLAKLTASRQTLLVLDYAERSSTLSSIINALFDVNADGASIHLLATSRPHQAKRLDDMGMTMKELTRQSDSSIVSNILGPELAEFAASCMGIPVFAAFVRLLRDREEHDALKKLQMSRDFRKWLRGHVQRLPNQEPDPMALALLLCAMPGNSLTVELIVKSSVSVAAYRASLLGDGWLVYTARDEPNWGCAHDLLSDGAVLELLDAENTRDFHAVQIVDFALDHGYAETAFKALARVSEDSSVQSVDWLPILSRRASDLAPMAGVVASTALIPAKHMVAWLDSLPRSREDLIRDSRVRSSLLEALRGLDLEDKELRAAWEPWVRVACPAFDRASDGSLFISRWLRSNGSLAAIASDVLAWLNRWCIHPSARFVLNAWLREYGDVQQVRPHVMEWLEHFSTHPEASSVMVAWLQLAKDWVPIEFAVTRWLQTSRNDVSERAFTIYGEWVKNTGAPIAIADHLRRWLDAWPMQHHTAFLFNKWLLNGGAKEYVADSVLKWLQTEEFHRTAMAAAVFQSWLRYAGDSEAINEELYRWLLHHQDDERVGDVVINWLRHRKPTPPIEEAVRHWLKVEGVLESDEAPQLFRRWLEQTGEAGRGAIQVALNQWMGEHASDFDACYVFEPLLLIWGTKGEYGKMALTWLSHDINANGAIALFMYRSWLRAGGAFAPILNPLEKWVRVERNCRNPRAVEVYVACPLPPGGFPYWLQSGMRDWLVHNAPSHELYATLAARIAQAGHSDE
jgi:hypothetical protein